MQPAEPQKTGADRWRWHYALIAFFGALLASSFVGVFAFLFWDLGGGDAENDKTFLLVASAISQLTFIGAALFTARLAGPIHLRDFGLVRAPFWPSVAKILAVMGSYLVILAIYSEAVNLAPDDAADELGAGTSDLAMLAFAVLVAMMAPIAEEVLFRGVIFRALSNGVGVVLGALLSGLIFGLVHIDSLDSERLLQVVPLCVLGIAFALAYWWSGTLFVPIAMHATNNALAVVVFASDKDSTLGIVAGVVIWILMMTFCAFGHRLTDRARPEAPLPPPSSAPPAYGTGPIL